MPPSGKTRTSAGCRLSSSSGAAPHGCLPTWAAIVLRQLPNLDQWDWGRLEPWVYFGDYSLRGKGARGLARAVVSGPEEDLSIEFNPAIEPGQAVNVVFRGFNPQSSIYQWSTELLADGEDPVRYLGPTLRLNVYQQDPYR